MSAGGAVRASKPPGATLQPYPQHTNYSLRGQGNQDNRKQGFRSRTRWDVLSRPYPFKLDVADLWARARPARIAEAETWTLCPEDLLLHLCLHATFHRKFVQEHVGLRPFCDIAESLSEKRS